MAVTTNPTQALVTVQRDRWGRYLIPDPITGKSRAWTRATTVASTLSDKFGLQQWAQRMTARGLVLRPDLFALLAACDPDDKKKLNGLVDDAKEAAAASSGANLGTALHSFTEQLDLGHVVNAPAPWDADLAAYKRTLERAGVRIDPAYVENIVTLPDFGVAGTFDRLVDYDGHLAVADLKTGSFLDWHEISIQLALYAHAATIYDPATNTHTPMPAVDMHRALVIHLPAGQAKCELWWVNILEGWEAAQEAMRVREWRTRKNLATKLDPGAPRLVAVDTSNLLEQQAAWLRGRVERIVVTLNGAPLPAPWPTTTPTFKQGGPTDLAQCDDLDRWCWDIETRLGIQFPDKAPHHAAFEHATAGMTKAQIAELKPEPGVWFSATDVARIVERNNNSNQEKETTR